MPLLKNIPRSAIIGLWLFICFAPFGWILFIAENRWAWIEMWPVLPGVVVSVLALHISQSSGNISVPISAVFSLVMAGGVLLVLWRLSHWRLTVALLALAAYCFFSWFAYKLYLL
jgi:hypothetical protein